MGRVGNQLGHDNGDIVEYRIVNAAPAQIHVHRMARQGGGMVTGGADQPEGHKTLIPEFSRSTREATNEMAFR